MIIKFKKKKMQKICNSPSLMLKHYNIQITKRLKFCLETIFVADEFEDLNKEPIKQMTGFHELKGDRKGEFAMSLTGNHRLILTKFEKNNKTVIILEIGTDYH